MNILVALSGGVDSSVAAAILKEQGHSLMGVTLKTFCYAEIEGGPKSCCGLEGIESARAVATKLDIPFTVFDVTERFKTAVIGDFVAEYAAGRTPNPCVLCNATVKIPDLLERARRLGCEAIATGHYAAMVQSPEGPFIERGKDRAKDQAYFLWAVPRHVLPHLVFPLGNMVKSEVRALARTLGLASADKAESQEICFVPDDDYAGFLRNWLPPQHPGFQPGNIVDQQGRTLARHEGYINFTIGQRKGLGGGHGRRLFVTDIQPETRQVAVGEGHEMLEQELFVDQLNLLAPEAAFDESFAIQIRHRAKPLIGKLVARSGEKGQAEYCWHIRLEEKARAITPGQSAVFFIGDRLLGGGRIRRGLP